MSSDIQFNDVSYSDVLPSYFTGYNFFSSSYLAYASFLHEQTASLHFLDTHQKRDIPGHFPSTANATLLEGSSIDRLVSAQMSSGHIFILLTDQLERSFVKWSIECIRQNSLRILRKGGDILM